jgi:hypothetical protein
LLQQVDSDRPAYLGKLQQARPSLNPKFGL